MNTTEDGSEEEGEYKKEKTKRGKFLTVKEERKDSSEVVVEVECTGFPSRRYLSRVSNVAGRQLI